MKQHRRFDLFQCFVLLLVCVLCAGTCAPAQAAGDVNTLKDALFQPGKHAQTCLRHGGRL